MHPLYSRVAPERAEALAEPEAAVAAVGTVQRNEDEDGVSDAVADMVARKERTAKGKTSKKTKRIKKNENRALLRGSSSRNSRE